MSETLYQVTLPYAVAGVVAVDGRVTEAAPLLKWTLGLPVTSVQNWARSKGGHVTRVKAGK